MGINGLTSFIRKHRPDVIQKGKIQDFAYKKCAVDTSLFFYKYLSIYGQEGWLNAFVQLVSFLRGENIHPCFIFDGGCPPEKALERERRKKEKKNVDDKIQKLEDELLEFHETGVLSNYLDELYEKKCIDDKTPKPLLLKKRYISTEQKVQRLEEELERVRNQSVSITPENISTLKKLLDLCNIQYIVAKLEAETLCADLCKREIVDFVISEDSDLLAYGCPILVKLGDTKGNCEIIYYNDVLESLDMTDDMFLDFCIMCGTDYNPNIKLVGPAKSYSLILNYNSIDNIKNMDVSVLNHCRIREIFRDYDREDIEVQYCGDVNSQELAVFLVKKNLKYDISKFKKVSKIKFV